MDLYRRLLEDSAGHVRTASLIASALGALSLLIGLRTWNDRGYLDYQTLFGIADAIAVMTLGFRLRRGSIGAAVLLLILGLGGIGYSVREGAPLIAAVPTIIAIGFYARALSALRFIRRTDGGMPGRCQSEHCRTDPLH